jgi:hypothetical protein
MRDNSKENPNLINTNNSSGSRQGDAQDPTGHLDQHDDGILETADSENLQDRAVLEEELDVDNSSEDTKSSLHCPLCRGTVLGWEVVEEARNYLNNKKRSCYNSSEDTKSSLHCPLCRGSVVRCVGDEYVRNYLNNKKRSCYN